MSDELENVENTTEKTSDLTPDTKEVSEKPKKKKSKARIIILVIVIVLVLSIGGGGVVYATQHHNPNFCNAVCHVPMDPYVQSFWEGTSINPNQPDLEAPLLVTVHAESDDHVICLDCHTDGLDIQIAEGITWITGNVPQPLNPLRFTFGPPLGQHERDGVVTCLVAGCHDGISSLDDLIKATSNEVRNGHDIETYLAYHTDKSLTCSSCHQAHEKSIMFCTQCHASDSPRPPGWLTFLEGQKQAFQK
ncbi:MAG: cytochrome c3 family protein [Coriobacteriia bacterium]|nr:cytochrome c3 family protein [Coriobacteriia bacterium]MCL2750082.1 cytochrome c3 family protein [Coriobacteriia bacterium]